MNTKDVDKLESAYIYACSVCSDTLDYFNETLDCDNKECSADAYIAYKFAEYAAISAHDALLNANKK